MKLKRFVSYILAATVFICQISVALADTRQDIDKLAEAENVHIGVYAVVKDGTKSFAYHETDRFNYCSTFKTLLVADVLKENTLAAMKEKIYYNSNDIVMYSPVTSQYLEKGMTWSEVAEAAMRKSDNTAANLLIQKLGGIGKFAVKLKARGDRVTKPIRLEPDLNVYAAGIEDDTTTPIQMVKDYQSIFWTGYLTDEKRFMLLNWMQGNQNTESLIKAGLSEKCQVFDKSGSGSHGLRNDVALIQSPGKPDIIIGIFTMRKEDNVKSDDRIISQVSKLVYNELTKSAL